MFNNNPHHPELVPDWVVYEIRHLNRRIGEIQMTLEELQTKADATLAQVTSDTAINNAVAKVVDDQRQTIVDLKSQLAAAGTDPVKLQALSDTLDNILALDTSNSKVVSDAVVANTPAPAPAPAPAAPAAPSPSA